MKKERKKKEIKGKVNFRKISYIATINKNCDNEELYITYNPENVTIFLGHKLAITLDHRNFFQLFEEMREKENLIKEQTNYQDIIY